MKRLRYIDPARVLLLPCSFLVLQLLACDSLLMTKAEEYSGAHVSNAPPLVAVEGLATSVESSSSNNRNVVPAVGDGPYYDDAVILHAYGTINSAFNSNASTPLTLEGSAVVAMGAQQQHGRDPGGIACVACKGGFKEWNAKNTPAWRSCSSVLKNSDFGSGYNRGALDDEQGWTPNSKNVGEWYGINTKSLREVAGVVTQGRSNKNVWPTAFRFMWSSDGTAWTDVDGGLEYAGNSDRSSRVDHVFAAPVLAKYIRIFPLEWVGGVSVTMRSGLLVTGKGPRVRTSGPK